MQPGSDGKKRCFGNRPGQENLAAYHDREWGVPVHDDRLLFEMLILEGAQAGLNWQSVLNRRAGYRRAFFDFVPESVANMTDAELEDRRADTGIIRNRLKIYAARKNARAFLQIQSAFGSFDAYLWRFVDGAPRINDWSVLAEVPATTAESAALSGDLKQRGMTFVGATIIYAYMQAVGMVDDHLRECWRRAC